MVGCPGPISDVCGEFVLDGIVTNVGHTGREVFFITNYFGIISPFKYLSSTFIFYVEIFSIRVLETTKEFRKLGNITRKYKVKMIWENAKSMQRNTPGLWLFNPGVNHRLQQILQPFQKPDIITITFKDSHLLKSSIIDMVNSVIEKSVGHEISIGKLIPLQRPTPGLRDSNPGVLQPEQSTLGLNSTCLRACLPPTPGFSLPNTKLPRISAGELS